MPFRDPNGGLYRIKLLCEVEQADIVRRIQPVHRIEKIEFLIVKRWQVRHCGGLAACILIKSYV